MDVTKADLIDRMNTMRIELIDRINKVKTDLIVWIVGVSVLQYILLMVTRKFFQLLIPLPVFHTSILPYLC